MKKRHIITALALCTAVGANANLSFTEDFSGGLMPANLETTGNAEGNDLIAFGDGTAKFNGQGDAQRQYLRTVESDYFAADFVMEVTYHMTGDGWWEAGFIGMGTGTTDGSFNNPGNPWFGVDLSGPGANGRIALRDEDWGDPGTTGPGEAWDFDPSVAGGTHRIQLTYTALDNSLRAAIDKDYAGGAFVADATSQWIATGSDNGFDASNSHILMGTAGNGSYFDDLSVNVIPEPATLSMVAILGGAMLFFRKKFII